MGEGIEDWERRRLVSRKQMIISGVALHCTKRKKKTNFFSCTGKSNLNSKVTELPGL